MAQDYKTFSDSWLAGLVRQGDPEAFVELSARYMGLIRSKAALFTGPAVPEPEDLLQEGFLGLYAAALGYQEDCRASFGTYAGTCVYHQMVTAVRSNATAGNRTLNLALPLEQAGDLPEAAYSPQDLVEIREQLDSLWRRLDLTALERRVLLLYLGGCKRTEIQEKEGIRLKAFDNALYRIRTKLRRNEKAGDANEPG